jgi:hypothetical protein
MTELVPKKEYFGCKFYELGKTESQVNSITIAFPELTIEGHTFHDVRISVPASKVSVDLTEGSYRYPKEIQIHTWSWGKPKVEVRALNNGHIRIEIPMSVDQGLGLFYDALGNFETVPESVTTSKPMHVLTGKSNVAELLV